MKRTDNDRTGRFAARFFSLLLTACLLTAGAAGASAAGYESYSYGYATGEAVAAPSPAPYLPERTVSLGALAGVKTAADFCRDAQGNWYVADSGRWPDSGAGCGFRSCAGDFCTGGGGSAVRADGGMRAVRRPSVRGGHRQ